MARRQDSGSNSAHQNQRPTSHNEDAVPEMTEETSARADQSDEDEVEEPDEDDDEEIHENEKGKS